MSQFIIELGSANEHRNDLAYLREMIAAVIEKDTGKHDVVFKMQLFKSAPPNRRLWWSTFGYAYGGLADEGYQLSASVFDEESLQFLLRFDVPFVKIACRPELYRMANSIPGLVYMSGRTSDVIRGFPNHVTPMCCVPKYPASIEEYEAMFTREELQFAVSDHTVGWDLYHKYQPEIIEKHFCLHRTGNNPDSGPFAVTPDQLAGVL